MNEDGTSELEQARDPELNTDTRQLFTLLSIAINLQRIADANETDTRDFFAGCALQGLVASGRYNAADEANEKVAKDAYWYADEMLKERNHNVDA